MRRPDLQRRSGHGDARMMLRALLGDGRTDAPAPAVPRRRFLQVGGVGVLSSVVLVACSRHSRGAEPAPTSTSTSTTTTTFPTLRDPGAAVDVLILRTGSSLEHYAAGVYTEAAGLDVVSTRSVLDTMKYFADQHSEHASAFEGATARAGGRPYTEPNKVLSRAVAAQLARLKSEREVLQFAYGLETLLAATHTATAGEFADRSFNPVVTGIGAVEARHIAALGLHLSGSSPAAGSAWPAYPGDGLLAVSGAIAPGLGF